jgi:hypothetical protein
MAFAEGNAARRQRIDRLGDRWSKKEFAAAVDVQCAFTALSAFS